MITRVLYYVDGSPFARMVRVLARLWNVPLTETEMPFPLPETFFDVSPLGHVPVLLENDQALFPTAHILNRLAKIAGRGIRDPQGLAATLSFTDSLVAAFYQEWAGTEPVRTNALGFDPARRNLARLQPFLNWIAPRLDANAPDATEVSLACVLLWTDSRRPLDWRGHAEVDRLVDTLAPLPAFQKTAPATCTGQSD